MATRRKSYRGLPPQHRQSASEALASMRRKQKEFNQHIKKGNCKMALYALSDVKYKHGEYRSEVSWAARARGAKVSSRAVHSLEQRFYKHCVR